ncbi:unnamed protein product [Durusdinium trenchii]|uniref:Secreted protein n=1 Tax=Durusdinium trenchii TaxID=1381693 RepID=A0ABP0MZT0_9DINO
MRKREQGTSCSCWICSSRRGSVQDPAALAFAFAFVLSPAHRGLQENAKAGTQSTHGKVEGVDRVREADHPKKPAKQAEAASDICSRTSSRGFLPTLPLSGQRPCSQKLIDGHPAGAGDNLFRPCLRCQLQIPPRTVRQAGRPTKRCLSSSIFFLLPRWARRCIRWNRLT